MTEEYRLISIRDVGHRNNPQDFDCGNDALNSFLSRYAKKNDMIGLGKTFVAIDQKEQLSGYFTLASAQVSVTELPEERRSLLPRYPIPALRIARLAVDKTKQSKGLGRWLLAQSFLKAVQVADVTGLYLILVDAKETSKEFYRRYGFQELKDEPFTLFITVETVRKAILG